MNVLAFTRVNNYTGETMYKVKAQVMEAAVRKGERIKIRQGGR